MEEYGVIVVGGGHAGCEAGLACARMGVKTLLCAIQEDSIGYMPCNPNIGGTAKGHLVREIDALGGEMGINADKSLLQLKMLNATKGAAVQSLRGQTDKNLYHQNMLDTIKGQENLTLLIGDCQEVKVSDGAVIGAVIDGEFYPAKAVVLATGTYLQARIITGEEVRDCGPSGFQRAEKLSACLEKLGLPLMRFKTGTPARIYKDSIDYSVMEREDGDEEVYSFSFLTREKLVEQMPCYLTYTNEETHRIIERNFHRCPMLDGTITGVGPRYCPSIESKILRFKDKTRHQVFVEPETREGDLMYIQGMSTSLPKDVQLEMYRSVKGLEHCEIAKWAYAIEYDAIDSTQLYPSLRVKHVKGLYCAGQLNGSSGYEEAGAQGLMAGINAVRELRGEEPVVLLRSQAYIGVLIDDLVTKGTEEPYRMMTARAEYRLILRQDNADMRLTTLGHEIGLASEERYQTYLKRKEAIEQTIKLMDKTLSPTAIAPALEYAGEPPAKTGVKIRDFVKRTGVDYKCLKTLPLFAEVEDGVLRDSVTEVKYEGYVAKEMQKAKEAERLESKTLPLDVDYEKIPNLRLEAREKLNKIKPLTLGQAERISGVSPADINILIGWLASKKR